MKNEYDALVFGAGHNSLTAAAYLAKSGLSVCVFEKNGSIGGGAVTHELTAPGFKHDSHATAIVLIMANPLLKDDELELKSKFGLRFVKPEASNLSIFEDESFIASYPSLDLTCESIARFSQKDAETYRAFALRTMEMGPLFTQGMFKPPADPEQMAQALMASEAGREVLDLAQRPVDDFILESFEHPKVQQHFLRWAAETHNPLHVPGTGNFLYFVTAVAHSQDQVAVVGGTGRISEALKQCIEHHGGEIRSNTWVKRVINSGGKATGVELDSGEIVNARKCVVGTIHPHVLGDYVEGINEDILQEARAIPLNAFGGLQAHFALNHEPVYKCQGAPKSLITHLLPLSRSELKRNYEEPAAGRLTDSFCPLAFTQTSHDPSRAPQGKHTLALYQFAPLSLEHAGPLGHGTVDGWTSEIRDEYMDWLLNQYQSYCTNMGSDNVIGSKAHSPYDMNRWNPSFRNGDIFGISSLIPTGQRPTPRLSQYAVPGVEGLYLAGPCTHPGGSVTGGGRATAIKILDDLGYNLPSLFNL